ncbi:Transposase IS4 [Popillia japonica]
MPLTSQIVLSLADSLLDQGYCITMDNYYTSPLLADYLISRQMTYGTMRINRKDLPTELQKKKLKKGEIIAFQRGKLMTMKWRDKKDVCLLSTIHNPTQVATNKRNKDGNAILKPKLVVDYNNTMGGIDRFDQQLHDYPIPRKRGKKYYKKIFFHLVDFCVYNAFILYRRTAGQKDHLEFRANLVENLISEYHTGLRTATTEGRPKVPGPIRLSERHFPEFIPPTEKKNSPTRCCAVCCKQRDEKGKRKRKETRYYCKPCDKGLCAVPCFMIFHTKLDF